MKRQQSFEKYKLWTCSKIKAQQSYKLHVLWNNTSLNSSNIPQFFYICSSYALRFSVLIELRSRVHIQQRNETFSGPPTGNHNLVCRVSSVSCSYEFSRSSRYISCTIQFSDTSNIFFVFRSVGLSPLTGTFRHFCGPRRSWVSPHSNAAVFALATDRHISRKIYTYKAIMYVFSKILQPYNNIGFDENIKVYF